MPAKKPPEERFWSKVEKTESCWMWTGAAGEGGYGYFGLAKDACVLAHRFSFVLAHGPVPPGLFVHHSCDNKLCVRPDHLFAVRNSDNILLSNTGSSGAQNFRKTTCPRGHPYDRTVLTPSGFGRRCVTCDEKYASEYRNRDYVKKKAAQYREKRRREKK